MTAQPAFWPILGSRICKHRVLRQLGSGAMGAAYEAGIIHCHLKPDNIFLHEAAGRVAEGTPRLD